MLAENTCPICKKQTIWKTCLDWEIHNESPCLEHFPKLREYEPLDASGFSDEISIQTLS